jgi:23S rRNA (guanosine2251-2'-O)-methyltransferase
VSAAIFGIHPVLEALRAGQRPLSRVLIAAGRHDARIDTIITAARAAGVPLRRQPTAALDRLAGGGRHQGVVALAGAALRYADEAEVLRQASRPALFVVLDGVEDPRNLGAVIRSAAAAGAGGLFLPSHGAAGLTGACLKASAGAAEVLPIARIGNVVSFLKSLKKDGIWVIGLDPSGPGSWTSFDMTQPLALVLGGEGRGLRRLARETCDTVLSIPLQRGMESLNLSVAAGVVLFEAVRQRRAGVAGGASEVGGGREA